MLICNLLRRNSLFQKTDPCDEMAIMKRFLYVSGIILFAAAAAHAQWTGKAGVNFVPLVARSVEATAEISNRSWYALTADLGYTFNTGHIGMFDYRVYDFYEDRKTAGIYSRLGARWYTNGFGPSKDVRFYVNPLLVISNYRQTALRTSPEEQNLPPVKVSASGTVLLPALRIGFTRSLSQKLSIDFGAQKALSPRRDDMFGTRMRNYQPGAGSGQSTPTVGYLQGYLALKMKF